jgi:hypothetical protein
MGIWRTAFRPHCLGLFVDKGVIYAQRDGSDPAFRLLATPEERREFLEPIPIPLGNARVFLDIEVGSRRPLSVPNGATLHCPSVQPRRKGNKYYTISIYTQDNNVYVGYPAGGGEARNVFRAIEKLVKSAHPGP